MGIGGSVGWCVERGVDRGVCDEVGSDYVILYLILMVDLILVILMDNFGIQMMENL